MKMLLLFIYSLNARQMFIKCSLNLNFSHSNHPPHSKLTNIVSFFHRMSGKRQWLDGDGRSIRQLELELELARLRREEEEEASTLTTSAAAEDEVEELPPPPPPSTSTPATANNNRQNPQQTPAASSKQTAGSYQQGQGRGGRRGGRGGHARHAGRGGRGGHVERSGLLTVFVCIVHDDLFCQV